MTEKNPKRVAAGKKGAETKKKNAELRRKESESIKKENMKLKEKEELKITKDPESEPEPVDSPKSKNKYILPVIAILGISGVGYYVYNNKKQKPVQKENKKEKDNQESEKKKKEVDPFEF